MPTADSRLVLVGGGHSHLFVLAAFARRPAPGVQLTLVSPSPLATYSGMIPGVIAGQYELGAAQVHVGRLAARAGARFLATRVVSVDARGLQVELSDGACLPYDLVSFDIGSRTALPAPAPADAAVVPVKPLETAVQAIRTALASKPGCRAAVIGAGAGGTELAFALAARLRSTGSVVLCDRAAQPVAALGARTARLAERALVAAGIQWAGGVAVEAIDNAGVHLRGGRLLSADLVVCATGAADLALFAAAGLPVDARGFLRVDDHLRSVEHPMIFAAGDCAALASYPDLPKAGVFAVRQGPLLAHNLRAALNGRALRHFRPRRRTLALLNTADGRAIFSYGPLAWQSRSVWWLKDWIDRRFVARFAAR